MKLAREDVVTSEIPVGYLEAFLNEIRKYPHLEYRGLKLRRDAQVKEILVTPDGTYTIIWSKYRDDKLKVVADVYIGARLKSNQWWDDYTKDAAKREELSERAREQFNEQQQEQWNSRSWWYKLWNEAPKPVDKWVWRRNAGSWDRMLPFAPHEAVLSQINKWNVIV